MLDHFIELTQNLGAQNIMIWNIIKAGSLFLLIVFLGQLIKRLLLPKLVVLIKKYNNPNAIVITGVIKKAASTWILLLAFYFSLMVFPKGNQYVIFMDKVLLVIAIFSVTKMLSDISLVLVKKYSNQKWGVFQNTSLFSNILAIAIFVFGGLIVLQSLGLSITPLLTALGVGGLAVALALQDTLSNFFAGFHILASRQLTPGDYIKLESGEEGFVLDITWRNTSVRSLKNNIHVIPNSKMASTILTNYYQPQKEMSFLVQVGVSYESDLEKVETATIEIAREVMLQVAGGVEAFEPFIRYHTFNDFSIDFSVIMRAKEFTDQYLLKHEFIKRLHKRYAREGINIPFPIRTIIQDK